MPAMTRFTSQEVTPSAVPTQLPAAQNTIDPQRAAAPHAPLVLIVEDQDMAREFLATMLAAEGYGVLEAANGCEALAILFGDSRPDVILLDLVMPIMDGWEFLEEQGRDPRLRTIPTIVVSGVPSHDPRCLEMPPVRFLRKPYTAEQLVAAIEADCGPRSNPQAAIR
jgi:CheY-like chemotaxis protein